MYLITLSFPSHPAYVVTLLRTTSAKILNHPYTTSQALASMASPISIHHATRSPNQLIFESPTLTGLPIDVREKIYNHVVEDEQLTQRRLTDPDVHGTQTALPWAHIRPPALIRVNRLLRTEYLPYFFLHTHFQIDARTSIRDINAAVENSISHIQRNVHHNFDPATLRPQPTDEPAGHWLESLRGLDLKIRHLQFRPLMVGGEPLGDILDIEYFPRVKVYRMRHRVDEGWGDPAPLTVADGMSLSDSFSGGRNHVGPFHSRGMLQASQVGRGGEEVLDINMAFWLELCYQSPGQDGNWSVKWFDYESTAFVDWEEDIPAE